MLVGLAILIRAHHVVPRGGVTVLAQLTAGAFGTGWAFYVSNLAVTVVLGLAANTSFGGLPVLMSILARDHRLPHVFYLRAERPVYRFGIFALAIAAALLLIAVDAETNRPDPAVRDRRVHRLHDQPGRAGPALVTRSGRSRWRLRVALNGTGAVMTAVAVVVFLGTQVPRGRLGRGGRGPAADAAVLPDRELLRARSPPSCGSAGPPDLPRKRESVVIVPTSTVSLLTEQRAERGAVARRTRSWRWRWPETRRSGSGLQDDWAMWKCAVPIEVIIDPHRSLVRTVTKYVDSVERRGRDDRPC